ncbi:bifunctional demethylmenaquinone methyltransferase/2-methoxy-6-polyprenyl-1,4-benzoquinol methylase UbiE [Methylohalobius crimeensis]|uniref:bifunctional demethylmenaquinone methyltransferase/2-methoxy-6-polyprenyl-1,4-benzoquinol methylase UbiE n=1 Tax=Methylohalobius crimeensis TaxID=244365 RepID=UPI0003B5DE99|nr:bifunctional demethylmenaquinone methyltransferase/2-methoxy-6-polyprenyl-1,4-benzoquinol methylase UbiE [Methylohalobius crimeensis]
MSDNKRDQTTHFGFRQVPFGEKSKLVRGVFDSVADSYDLMNDLMSFGVHRLWKHLTIHLSNVRYGERVLDLAGGTGDLTRLFRPRVGDGGEVILADINAAMLRRGRDRLTDEGLIRGVRYVQVDAQYLPFADETFDCVTIGFGLRNVTDKNKALQAMYRVLKPGGRLLILEFSKPKGELFGKFYDFYSFKMLPLMGKLVAGDADSYRYLAESIRVHPDQNTLKGMMAAVGFDRIEYFNLTQGVVAIHRGYKL